MKKILFAVCMLFTMALSAQTMKGNWLVGGSGGFNSYKPDGASESGSSFHISPNLGYFVMDNLAVGASLGFESVKESYSSFGFGPFVRYYFANLGESAKLMGQVSYTINSITPEGGKATSGNTLGVAAGLAYFLNPHVALEGIVGYRADSGDLGKGSGFGINFGFQIHLGGE
jgi:outer membrane protein